MTRLDSSLVEDVSDSKSMTEAWNKIDKFYTDVERFRNFQKCTGSKSFSLASKQEVEGHTKYLQGLDLPIMVNSCFDSGNNCIPSKVSEMHIGEVEGELVLLVTPERISLS